ncbi:hypothetical protein GCM10010954_12260 [Halobacillus andaensis]|uniref:Lipoprotein n=1 Tax=Halobacillus andaensis TaxID=1176239 RepID=A0A917EUF8_HALAA|nr:hypothetical protein [Halobacillus andaensis]MBP2004022.1 major membrane immunogen (membrane-anchored lipoprotein) [Halobacillus andaensis]GGF15195.1 hypothetical protein GCM10010954_12260 [Halobacillus andaensis]
MKLGTLFLSVMIFLSILLTGCGTNNQEQPENQNMQQTRYEQQNQQDQRDQMGPNINDEEQMIDYDEQEPDVGEEPSEERRNKQR